MKKRKLGRHQVSVFGLGWWQLGGVLGPLGKGGALVILRAADESGIDFWDTADVYGNGHSESMIEQYRYEHQPAVVVATKVGRDSRLYPDHYTKERVRANIAGSAARLGVETLDLVQLHCVPPALLKAGDLLRWMEDFRAEGLIRAFGEASNH
jgi:aryl-alcohol dehydrogenase-like predicted oxidoreductase